MSDLLPTAQQLETFSRLFNKITRKHPYVTHFMDLSWDERVETMTRVNELEHERERVASLARKYGYRRGFAPELSIQADALVKKMEDLVPDSTGGMNNKWSKIEFLRMDGNELRWYKWYQSHLSVAQSTEELLIKPHTALHPDEETLTVEEVKADVLHRLQMAEYLMQSEFNTCEYRVKHPHLSDAEYSTLVKESVHMAEQIPEFLRYIRCWKTSDALCNLTADRLLLMNCRDALAEFLKAAGKDTTLLLGLAVYHKHLLTVNPHFINYTKTDVVLDNFMPKMGHIRMTPLGEYFRPHVREKDFNTLKTDEAKDEGNCVPRLFMGFGARGDFQTAKSKKVPTYRR